MTEALLELYPCVFREKLSGHVIDLRWHISDAPVYHLGLYREKVTLQPVECKSKAQGARHLHCSHHGYAHPADAFIIDYSKLPSEPPIDECWILDPLIATGGTALSALHMIVEWGVPRAFFLLLCKEMCMLISIALPVSKIKLLCVLASEDGLKHVQAQFPDVEVSVPFAQAGGRRY